MQRGFKAKLSVLGDILQFGLSPLMRYLLRLENKQWWNARVNSSPRCVFAFDQQLRYEQSVKTDLNHLV